MREGEKESGQREGCEGEERGGGCGGGYERWGEVVEGEAGEEGGELGEGWEEGLTREFGDEVRRGFERSMEL